MTDHFDDPIKKDLGADMLRAIQKKHKVKIPGVKSWYCDRCHVEVRQLRCVHCGKSEREKK